jgi:hypothetical protein
VTNLTSAKSPHALDVQGFKHAPIINLRLENCAFSQVAEPSIIKNVEGLRLNKVRVNGRRVETLT